MKSKAYAKINLSLNVKTVEKNGYHKIESVFLPIDFYDVVEINKSNKMKFRCNKLYIRFNKQNTIVKAINYMKEKYNINDNFEINLKKMIPSQAGLGGGSSDGAATIKILNQLYNLNMSDNEIKAACLAIGSDVYFTYYSKPAFVFSYGEELTFIDVQKDYYALLIKPSFGISTKRCYQNLNMETCDHPDIEKLIISLEGGQNIDGLLGNSLEQSSISIKPDIQKIKSALLKKGAPNSIMSGSGSTVFCISENKDLINNLSKSMKKIGHFVRVVHIIK